MSEKLGRDTLLGFSHSICPSLVLMVMFGKSEEILAKEGYGIDELGKGE